jgi:hypothetical protein
MYKVLAGDDRGLGAWVPELKLGGKYLAAQTRLCCGV